MTGKKCNLSDFIQAVVKIIFCSILKNAVLREFGKFTNSFEKPLSTDLRNYKLFSEVQ